MTLYVVTHPRTGGCNLFSTLAGAEQEVARRRGGEIATFDATPVEPSEEQPAEPPKRLGRPPKH